MELDMEGIAEPLRKVAAEIFEEMEKMKRQEFTAAVSAELHQCENGGEAGGSGDDGGGRRGEGGEVEGNTLEGEEERDRGYEKGGVRDDRRGEDLEEEGLRMDSPRKLLQDGSSEAQVPLKSSSQGTKNRDSAQSSHSSFISTRQGVAETDLGVRGTGTGSSITGGNSSSQPLAGLPPLAMPQQLLASQSLGKETERTKFNSVLHHTPLTKDKAA